MATSAAPSADIAGFTPTPNSILLDSKLSPETKLVYQIIRYHDRGGGCFAARETMAQEIGLSLYHLRKAICELVSQGIITLEKRRMGLTDVIRLVDRDWGLSREDQVEEPSEPRFEMPSEPELSDEPQIPEEPVQVEEEPDNEPVQEVQPVEHQAEIGETPASNSLNYKNDSIKQDKTNKHTPSVPESTESQSQRPTKKQCDFLISHFYELKEHRQPTQNEVANWTSTARRLLGEFTLPELKEATKHAIDQGARLFYFVALVGPSFILKRRQEKEAEIDQKRETVKQREQEKERRQRWEKLRWESRIFQDQTESLLNELSKKIRPQSFNVWFKDTFVNAFDEGSITLAAPSDSSAQWISENYVELVSEISGKEVKVTSV